MSGVWKFGTGSISRRVASTSIVLVSGSVAGLVYLAFGALIGDLSFDRHDLIPGLLGGLLNLCGNLLILRAFATGKLGVASALGSMYVLVPLVYSFILGEPMTALSGIGIAVMLVGLVVFSAAKAQPEQSTGDPRRAIGFAVGAALMWGLAVVSLDIGSRANLYGSLAISEIPQVTITLAVVVAMRSFSGLRTRDLPPLAGTGLALSLANIAFFTAANEGDIGVVSILAGLSPIFTAGLAWLVLKERMNRSEIIALVVVLTGTGMVVA